MNKLIEMKKKFLSIFFFFFFFQITNLNINATITNEISWNISISRPIDQIQLSNDGQLQLITSTIFYINTTLHIIKNGKILNNITLEHECLGDIGHQLILISSNNTDFNNIFTCIQNDFKEIIYFINYNILSNKLYIEHLFELPEKIQFDYNVNYYDQITNELYILIDEGRIQTSIWTFNINTYEFKQFKILDFYYYNDVSKVCSFHFNNEIYLLCPIKQNFNLYLLSEPSPLKSINTYKNSSQDQYYQPIYNKNVGLLLTANTHDAGAIQYQNFNFTSFESGEIFYDTNEKNILEGDVSSVVSSSGQCMYMLHSNVTTEGNGK
jgi:hypothetical protein